MKEDIKRDIYGELHYRELLDDSFSFSVGCCAKLVPVVNLQRCRMLFS
jgi:hypothetical protein